MVVWLVEPKAVWLVVRKAAKKAETMEGKKAVLKAENLAAATVVS